MASAPVALALVADHPATRASVTALFPEAERHVLTRAELRPEGPFVGALFELLAAVPAGACLGLVVPVRLVGRGAAEPAPAAPPSAALPPLLAVSDHVNLTLASPLAGRWPAGRERTFPLLTGIYQPERVRACGGALVYCSDVVAGVADAARLTPFEAAVVHAMGYRAVADVLVPVAIVAAYYGLTLAACGVPQAEDCEQG